MSIDKFSGYTSSPDVSPTHSSSVPKNEKILVVEPDAALSEILGILFTEQGYDFRVISHISDIRPVVAEFLPVLVLIEYYLPEVNGGELCLQIKEDERFSHIPVVMYSAYPQLLWSVADYSCDSFIGKPFDLNELQNEIGRLLAKSKRKGRSKFFKKLSLLAPFLGEIASLF